MVPLVAWRGRRASLDEAHTAEAFEHDDNDDNDKAGSFYGVIVNDSHGLGAYR